MKLKTTLLPLVLTVLAVNPSQAQRHLSTPHQEICSAPTHWATRYQGAFCESLSALSDAGDGVRDGWDYPNRGLRIDGATANFRTGYKTSALTAYFRGFNIPSSCTEITALTVRVRLSGSGHATLILGSECGSVIENHCISLSPDLCTREFRIDQLRLPAEQARHLTLAISHSEGQNMRVDGMEISLTIAPPRTANSRAQDADRFVARESGKQTPYHYRRNLAPPRFARDDVR